MSRIANEYEMRRSFQYRKKTCVNKHLGQAIRNVLDKKMIDVQWTDITDKVKITLINKQSRLN